MYYFVTSYYFKRACENHAISENYYNKEKTKNNRDEITINKDAVNTNQYAEKLLEYLTDVNIIIDIID